MVTMPELLAEPPMTDDSRHERPAADRALNCAFVAAAFKHDPDWPWLSRVGPFADCNFARHYIDNIFKPFPKATRFYQQWQYRNAARSIKGRDIAFLFSPEVGIGVTRALQKQSQQPRTVYVGLHQDSPLPEKRIVQIGAALRACDATAILTEEERELYIPRYGLDADRCHVVPIHTDHADGYGMYPDESPEPQPYVLSMGSPNRIFKPVVEACAAAKIPLVVITRPWHRNDDLDELADVGAKIVTDADMMKALTYLKHAKLTVVDFERTEYASGFITLVHAMFLRTPIVASQCVGIPEHIIDGETGFVTPHGDSDALRNAIESIWNDDAQAEQFAQAAYDRAQARHSLESGAKMYFDFAQTVVTKPR